tara:strand:- start:626 stop:955 length:330 start_codon:yes stop_codon:yes gene_type:complete
MLALKAILYISLLFSYGAFASRPLFNTQELKKVEYLKTDRRMIFDQLQDLKNQDKNYFKNVLLNTSAEDLKVLRLQIPKILDLMEKSDEAAWLKKTLEELSKNNQRINK